VSDTEGKLSSDLILSYLCYITSQIFKDATLFLLHDGIAILTMVIPAMDHIGEALAMSATKHQFLHLDLSGSICWEEDPGSLLQKTDLSYVYRIAMGA
jgi:hypothetical protein